jgi:hypothetical protein
MTSLTGRIVMQKDPRHEGRSYLDLTHGAPCHLNFTGCTGGTDPDAPSVPCHSNWQADGRGFSHKTHDDTVVPGCPSCHFQLDTGTLYTQEQKQETFYNGQRRWWHFLLSNKWLIVNKQRTQ